MIICEVHTSERTKDATVALCVKNIWLISAIYSISIYIEHIPGKSNVADLSSRFKFDIASWQLLHQHVPQFVRISLHIDLTKLNYDL